MIVSAYDRPIASFAVSPNMRWAPGFQVAIRPLRSCVTIASGAAWTSAASCARSAWARRISVISAEIWPMPAGVPSDP